MTEHKCSQLYGVESWKIFENDGIMEPHIAECQRMTGWRILENDDMMERKRYNPLYFRVERYLKMMVWWNHETLMGSEPLSEDT